MFKLLSKNVRIMHKLSSPMHKVVCKNIHTINSNVVKCSLASINHCSVRNFSKMDDDEDETLPLHEAIATELTDEMVADDSIDTEFEEIKSEISEQWRINEDNLITTLTKEYNDGSGNEIITIKYHIQDENREDIGKYLLM